ncbi:HscB family protein [Abortiporus biennis]
MSSQRSAQRILASLRRSHLPPTPHRSLLSQPRLVLSHQRRPCPPFPHLRCYSTQPPLTTCPACSAPLPTALPICPKCSFIQPSPSSISYHELLGLPYEPNPFHVNAAALKRQFIVAQGVVHPDRWSGKPEDKQALASHASTLVNDAYTTLSNPVKRVFYILNREGFKSDGEASLEDPALLADIMEQHEALENAMSQEEVDVIRETNKEAFDDLVQVITGLVEAKDWPAVQKNAIALKYRQGIDTAAKSWPEKPHDH